MIDHSRLFHLNETKKKRGGLWGSSRGRPKGGSKEKSPFPGLVEEKDHDQMEGPPARGGIRLQEESG